MSVVVVIAVAVVSVMAFVKVKKHNKEIEDIHHFLGREFENQNRERENVVHEIYRTLDSRLDKLESKLSRKEA